MISLAFGEDGKGDDYAAYARAMTLCKQLEAELDDMREMFRELIPLIPTAYCEMFHHEKKDQHAYDEECKPLSRYNAKIQKAKEALGL